MKEKNHNFSIRSLKRAAAGLVVAAAAPFIVGAVETNDVQSAPVPVISEIDNPVGICLKPAIRLSIGPAPVLLPIIDKIDGSVGGECLEPARRLGLAQP